jgi:hypothetical protein
MPSPIWRRRQILDLLAKEGTVSLREIAEKYSVSMMTIHRDVEVLARQGALQRVRGGIQLASPVPVKIGICAACNQPVTNRSGFFIFTHSGSRVEACCPHCGIMLASRVGGARELLATDFLYGTVMDARRAAFLVSSSVRLCCSPSILCFENHEDAARFRSGFGGQVLTYSELLALLVDGHSERDQPHHTASHGQEDA